MNKMLKLFIFTVISLIFIISGLILANKYVKKEKKKDLLFIIFAVLTVLIHYSTIFYSLINNEPVEILDTYYLPVYPCNLIMWEAIALSVLMIINKKGILFDLIANAMFFSGTVFVFVGIEFNINFLNNPDFLDFEILKGLLSHVTLLFCCLYLYVGKYVKITGIKNYFAMPFQSAVIIFCGVYTNTVLKLLNKKAVNSMLLQGAFFEDLPFTNAYFAIVVANILFLIFFTIFEIKTKPKEEVWYNKIRRHK